MPTSLCAAALSLWLVTAPSQAPLPRLAEPLGDAGTMPTWPPVPEGAATEPAPQVQHRGAIGYGDSAPELAAPVPADAAVFARAPGDDDDGAEIEWRIGQRRVHHANHDISVTGGIWPATLAAGVWWGLPLLKRGLISSINDGFFLELGALFMGNRLWGDDSRAQFNILPAAGVRWDFYLTRTVTLFATAKLGPRIGVSPGHRVLPDPVIASGLVLNLWRRAGLRFELGYPQGFTLGVSVPLGQLPAPL